ncbi:MAG: hypothetical protein HZB87_12705 [Desulfatitalea sp.]|nr:hypothetical protein [Desulfatitalea sp.]
MRFFKWLLCIPALIGALAASANAGEYWIKVQPTVIDAYQVEIAVQTNIPGPLVLAARLALTGLKPDDPHVGTGFMRLPVAKESGKMTIHVEKHAMPRGTRMFSGVYNVEIFFYAAWPDNTQAIKLTGIADTIRVSAPVRLIASGPAPGANTGAAKTPVIDADEGYRWVTENVFEGFYFQREFWENKSGALEQVEYKGGGDPAVFKMYYIKSIHMTLLVDDEKKNVITYRRGLAHE